MKLFYATIDYHLDVPIVWEFTVKPRKDGSYKAEVMLPFMRYITILQKHHLVDCATTEIGAVDKLIDRKLHAIKQIEKTRIRLVEKVNQINSTTYKLVKFPKNLKFTAKSQFEP